ncbi:hypothetical protein V1511DRAFT_462000 [Dipodascopsis uninucleata]
MSARSVPPHSPAAVSALTDDISTMSISPHTPLPPQLQLRNQNQSQGGRDSLDTDERAYSQPQSDVIIKSGWLSKRGKQKWSWSRRWFVLRPGQLSIYKDDTEYKALDIIPMTNVSTAVILEGKDKKRKTHFAVFTTKKNFHLQADSSDSAEHWVNDIKNAARLASQSESRPSTSIFRPSFQMSIENTKSKESLPIIPSATNSADNLNDHPQLPHPVVRGDSTDRLFSRSPSLLSTPGSPPGVMMPVPTPTPPLSTHANSYYEFSGNEDGGFSSGASDYGHSGTLTAPSELHLADQSAGTARLSADDSRVAYDLAKLEKDKVLKSGYLLRLVKRMNQWKRKWVVLRLNSLTFYKSDDEYQSLKVVPLSEIIDVMEIDALSRTKKFCLQVILSEKRIRLCASNAEDQQEWLAAFKSAIANRKTTENEG